MTQIYVKDGQTGFLKTGYSEVLSHLKLAGKTLRFCLKGHGVQLFTFDTKSASWAPYSFPVLPSEAGLYWDNERKSYFQHSDKISLDARPFGNWEK